jgi:hypothetical protein
MSAQDGASRAPWKALGKPPARVTAFAQGVLDLILPPRAFDGGAALTSGLSAEAWNRITFLDGPGLRRLRRAVPVRRRRDPLRLVPDKTPRLRPSAGRLSL